VVRVGCVNCLSWLTRIRRIIFIDDRRNRSRSSDGEESSSERDSTLNELLVGLDGFNTGTDFFNRCDEPRGSTRPCVGETGEGG
jgi:hypothetical protein